MATLAGPLALGLVKGNHRGWFIRSLNQQEEDTPIYLATFQFTNPDIDSLQVREGKLIQGELAHEPIRMSRFLRVPLFVALTGSQEETLFAPDSRGVGGGGGVEVSV